MSRTTVNEALLCHLDVVYRIAVRLSGNTTEADDLVQETFLRAQQGIDHFDLRAFGAKPWLLKILHNVFYTRRARAGRQPTLLQDVDFDNFAAELERSPLPHLEAGQLNWEHFDQELKAAVDRLLPEYREVMLLWSLGDLSYKEISEVLQCPVGTVMSRLFRARHTLMNELASYAAARGLSRGST